MALQGLCNPLTLVRFQLLAPYRENEMSEFSIEHKVWSFGFHMVSRCTLLSSAEKFDVELSPSLIVTIEQQLTEDLENDHSERTSKTT